MAKYVPIAVSDTGTDDKCDRCTNTTCCTYVTQQIDTPRSMEEYDTLLWQVSHGNTQIYKDEGDWYLLVYDRCTHILPGGRCGIYERRPQICRDHSNDDCEFNTPSSHDDFDLLFTSYKELDDYCRKRFKTWDRRFEKWNARN